MLNRIDLMGRMVAKPEMKKAGEHQVCSFTLAVQRSRNRDKTDFIPCKAWDSIADLICKHFNKGDRIVIVGSLQNNSFTGADGTMRSFFEVETETFEFVEKKAQ